MTVTILIVDKSGTIQECELKTYNESELYKKAGLKSASGFELQTEWGAEIDGKSYSVSVFGKDNGRAGQENKYEFPPPIDSVLLFGSCILVNKDNNKAINISRAEWAKVYEHLFGGFDDIGAEDSELSEDDVDDDVSRTKEGYVKDDFVVDDDTEYETEESEEELDSEEEIVVKKKPIVKKPAAKAKKPKKIENVFQIANENNYLNCEDELSEEEYL
uniref:Uncharacterized protein n=1 Tax=viral metagenome TaxID=1070528 RepID=A0A6C0B7W6_9ZZZZ